MKQSNRGRKNLGPMPLSMLRHGEASTYGNYGCRCPLCTHAWAERTAKYRRRKVAP